MTDERIFGCFSILLGCAVMVLSSFLETMPMFLIVGMITGAGILISGVVIVTIFLSARYCPECGEILQKNSYQCAVCGHQISIEITSALIRRLLH